eukprot:TRINITY_DN2443_c0_g1_i1.p1 TRINITY_DN2443_c0_g1~~TRINITY_DN2443_c0_g1_i1.p1  ORF type:complete len:348 (-),score=92.64 TRINITY_DN2443_c0_g1_i1:24-1067(-)
MSTAEMLNGVNNIKLRKTKIERDASAPQVKEDLSNVEEISNYQNRVLDSNLECWLDLIKEETFPTQFYPLTVDDAKAFIRFYEEKSKDISQLKSIEEGLQKVIDAVKSNGEGAAPDECVFVKTSCRSAKDTAVFDARFRSLYRDRLSQKQERNENDKLASLLEAAIEILKVRSAAEVLLSFCTSERVYQDMLLALQHPERFEQHFIVRKWVDIDPDMEFRAFYSNGKLNAVSQYNHLCYYPRVVENKDIIQERILTFFETTVKSKLQSAFKEYVIDFAICGENLDKVWVIELNPFIYTTDGCLFSWQHERHILENGPFEFRVRKTVASGAKSMLSWDWRLVVEQEKV